MLKLACWVAESKTGSEKKKAEDCLNSFLFYLLYSIAALFCDFDLTSANFFLFIYLFVRIRPLRCFAISNLDSVSCRLLG